MIIPEWLFEKPIENTIQKRYNPNPLRQIAGDNIKSDGKELNNKLAKKRLNPYYFTDRKLKVGFRINLDSRHINHANSNVFIKPNYLEFGIEVRYIIKIMKELFNIYARLINRYKFKYQTVFSTRCDKQHEDNQVLGKTETFINLNKNHNLTETYIGIIDIKPPLENQIQQELKDSGWRFDKPNSMIYFFQNW